MLIVSAAPGHEDLSDVVQGVAAVAAVFVIPNHAPLPLPGA